MAVAPARGPCGPLARFARYGRWLALVPGLRCRSRPWQTPPDILSGALIVKPNACIAPAHAYNPHSHRPRGRSSPTRFIRRHHRPAAGFNVRAAADKRYSLCDSKMCIETLEGYFSLTVAVLEIRDHRREGISPLPKVVASRARLSRRRWVEAKNCESEDLRAKQAPSVRGAFGARWATKETTDSTGTFDNSSPRVIDRDVAL
jgi:hypothetical protein